MTSGNLQFRIATPDDAAQLQPLVQSAYRGESSRQGWTTESDLLRGVRIDVDGIITKITQPDGAVLLATSDNDDVLVACCEVVKRSADVAHFGLFAVAPRRQGGGLGRQVLAYARFSQMSVIWSRTELIEWYVRRGYRRTGEERPFPLKELAEIGVAGALRDDLHFEVLEKELRAVTVGAVTT
ncbi:putative acetyltransferase [Hypoxylon fuscum]|nr:putative acetyltransferase [Hypoxylon fuscum]